MSEEKNATLTERIAALREQFHPSHVSFKPGKVSGNRGLALAYVDLRAYQERLDDVFGQDWSISYQPWGDNKLIATLTLRSFTGSDEVSRSAVGEGGEAGDNGGTSCEAQAFKRACAQFGLGRYLYGLPQTWADFDPTTKQFTPQAKVKLQTQVAALYTQATGQHVDVADVQVPEPGPFSTGLSDIVDGFIVEDEGISGTSKLGEFVAAVRAKQASGGKPASEAQLKKLANTLAFAAGRGSNGYSAIELMLGNQDTPTSWAASMMIDTLDRTTWNREAQQAEENPKYDKEVAHEFQRWYDSHRT